ncbi:MAG: MFS transporter [Alphaproteobacteria bacterium]|nr:MAG: MFS transporter [Alphaproteobacteria bacterium]
MRQSAFHLLADRRFLPLFVTQFLGAFNDNLFKNALVILITYRLAALSPVRPEIMVTFAAGFFILPFFLFSATAGQLADKLEKSRLIARIKLAEVLIMIFGVAGLWANDLWLLLGVLFCMGTQSAFFGPLKYGILPQHLTPGELVGGNGLIGAATFIAILLGTIVGGVMILKPGGTTLVGALLLGCSVAGYIASRFIPNAPAGDPSLQVRTNFLAATWALMRNSATPALLPATLGISWFWFLGATHLAQFPNLAKLLLGANEDVVVFFLVTFVVGIAAGALACNLVVRGRVSTAHVPLMAMVLAVVSVDLWFALDGVRPGGVLLDLPAFLAQPVAWRLTVDLLVLAAAGGLYVVPLYALLQDRATPDRRARTIAALNVMNAAFMVASAVGGMAAFAAGLGVAEVIAGAGVLSVVPAVYLKLRLRRE